MNDEILFETPRLFLRNITLKDLKWFHQLGTDPEVMKYIRPVNYDIGRSQQELEKLILFTSKFKAKGYWLACDKVHQNPLGIVTLRYLEGSSETELGFRWSRGSWGKGLATEAAKAAVKFGFESRVIPRMVAVVHPENARSQKVLEKCGFGFKGPAFYYNSKVKFYQLSREDFEHGQTKP